MGRWQFAGVVVGVLALAYVANAAPMFGEQQTNTQRNLATVTVSWANPNTTLYTCTNSSGCVMLHIVPRSPSGTQPLSFTLSNGGNTSSAFTTASVTLLNTFSVPTSLAAVSAAGQSLVITPLTTTTGSIVVDIQGYEIVP